MKYQGQGPRMSISVPVAKKILVSISKFVAHKGVKASITALCLLLLSSVTYFTYVLNVQAHLTVEPGGNAFVGSRIDVAIGRHALASRSFLQEVFLRYTLHAVRCLLSCFNTTTVRSNHFIVQTLTLSADDPNTLPRNQNGKYQLANHGTASLRSWAKGTITVL